MFELSFSITFFSTFNNFQIFSTLLLFIELLRERLHCFCLLALFVLWVIFIFEPYPWCLGCYQQFAEIKPGLPHTKDIWTTLGILSLSDHLVSFYSICFSPYIILSLYCFWGGGKVGAGSKKKRYVYLLLRTFIDFCFVLFHSLTILFIFK